MSDYDAQQHDPAPAGMPDAPVQGFVFFATLETNYRRISDAAASRGMTVPEYASLALQRQIEEDEERGRVPR